MQPRKSLEYGEYDINDNDTKDNLDNYIENEEDVQDDEFSNTIKVFDQNPTASQETIIDDYMEYGKYFLGCMFLSLGFCPVILLLNLVCNSVNIARTYLQLPLRHWGAGNVSVYHCRKPHCR